MSRALVAFIVFVGAASTAVAVRAAPPDGGQLGPGGPAGGGAPAATQDGKTITPAEAKEPANPRAALCKALNAEGITNAKGCEPSVEAKNEPLNSPRALPASVGYTQLHAAPIPAAVAEIASLLVEIAVDKAKRSGLEIVRGKIQSAVCDLENARWGKVLPATCQLVTQVSLERLASSPDAILVALANDLVGHVVMTEVKGDPSKNVAGFPEQVRPVVELAVSMTSAALTKSPAGFAPSDAWALLGTALNSVETFATESPNADSQVAAATVKVSLRALRACVRLLDDQPNASCDAVFMAKAVLDAHIVANPKLPKVELAKVVEIVALGQKVLGGGTASAQLQAATARLRFRDAVEFVFTLAQKLFPSTDVSKIRRVVLAALDGDVAIVVSSGADLLIDQLPDDDQRKSLRKVNLVVSAIGSYAETFSKAGGGEAAAQEKEKLRAARKEILENLIEAATVRTDRHGEWVVSIGMPVGFVTGWQWQRAVAATGSSSFGDAQGMAPQLELGLGVGLQRLPAKNYLGFHAMALLFDLGQFAAYDSNGQITQPRWDTVISPGAQVGFALGTPSNVFVVAAEARYAPTLFSDNPGSGAATNGGAIRFGLIAAYHVSFFDFN